MRKPKQVPRGCALTRLAAAAGLCSCRPSSPKRIKLAHSTWDGPALEEMSTPSAATHAAGLAIAASGSDQHDDAERLTGPAVLEPWSVPARSLVAAAAAPGAPLPGRYAGIVRIDSDGEISYSQLECNAMVLLAKQAIMEQLALAGHVVAPQMIHIFLRTGSANNLFADLRRQQWCNEGRSMQTFVSGLDNGRWTDVFLFGVTAASCNPLNVLYLLRHLGPSGTITVLQVSKTEPVYTLSAPVAHHALLRPTAALAGVERPTVDHFGGLARFLDTAHATLGKQPIDLAAKFAWYIWINYISRLTRQALIRIEDVLRWRWTFSTCTSDSLFGIGGTTERSLITANTGLDALYATFSKSQLGIIQSEPINGTDFDAARANFVEGLPELYKIFESKYKHTCKDCKVRIPHFLPDATGYLTVHVQSPTAGRTVLQFVECVGREPGAGKAGGPCGHCGLATVRTARSFRFGPPDLTLSRVHRRAATLSRLTPCQRGGAAKSAITGSRRTTATAR